MSTSRTSPPESAPVEPGNERLDSWKEIAAYFRRDESTVRRWEKDGLPVHRRMHRAKATVFAYRAELDAWWRQEPELQGTASADPSAAPPVHRTRWAPLTAAMVAALVLAIVAIVLLRSSRVPSAPLATTLFISSQGQLSYPAFSPDGTRLAFTWVNPEQPAMEIYVKAIGAEAPLRLTHTTATENFAPKWSPQGDQIAFLRRSPSEAGIFIVSPTGGAERKLFSLPPDRYYALDWSSDGKHIAFARRESPDDPYAVYLLSLDDGRERQLTFPPKHIAGDARFAISPDAKSLAFIRHAGTLKPNVSIEIVSLAAPGTSRVISSYTEWIGSLAWSSDSRSVILSGNVHGVRKLWRVYLEDGHQEPLTDAGEGVYYPTVAHYGDRLAFVREIEDADLWRVELSASTTPAASSPVRVNFSTRVEGAPRFSPDGKRIAFMSYRTGLPELWVSDPDGGHAVQVTAFGTSGPELPRWSPDGQTLVFAGGGPFQLVRATGGQPQQVPGLANITYPSWSRDGTSIYFCRSGPGGVAEIWKMPVAGGSATLVVETGISLLESPDGKMLYYTKGGVNGIWSKPVSGGKETLVIERFRPDFPGYWTVMNDGIYFLDADAKPQPTINFFSFATHKTTPVIALSGAPDAWRGGLTVSHDGRSLIYSQQQYSSYEIVVAERLH